MCVVATGATAFDWPPATFDLKKYKKNIEKIKTFNKNRIIVHDNTTRNI